MMRRVRRLCVYASPALGAVASAAMRYVRSVGVPGTAGLGPLGADGSDTSGQAWHDRALRPAHTAHPLLGLNAQSRNSQVAAARGAADLDASAGGATYQLRYHERERSRDNSRCKDDPAAGRSR